MSTHHRRPSRASTTPPLRRKLVIVGDGACGKTCLLMRFTEDTYNADSYIPTVFENHVKDVVHADGTRVELTLWDTAGQEDYDRLRPLSYPDSDVVVIAFAVDAPDSLDNVYEKWIQEVRHFCPDTPVVLVALKVDLRAGGGVSRDEGERAARELGCVRYLECSSKTGEGVLDVFECASRLGVGKRRRRRTCVIL